MPVLSNLVQTVHVILQPWISCRPGRNKYRFSFFRFIRFTFFVICNFDFTFFFNSLRNNPWWCFSLTGGCHVFHDEFRIDEIRRDSPAINQRKGNQQFLPNNVIGCYSLYLSARTLLIFYFKVLVISRYWMTWKYEKSTGWKKRKLLAQVPREYQLAQRADLCSVWLATGPRLRRTLSWREQVNFQRDDDEVRIVLDHHAELYFCSVSSWTETTVHG